MISLAMADSATDAFAAVPLAHLSDTISGGFMAAAEAETPSEVQASIELTPEVTSCPSKTLITTVELKLESLQTVAVDRSLKVAAASSVPLLAVQLISAKPRKQRKKLEKAPSRASETSLDSNSELFEPSVAGSKKKSALESLRLAQGLFKFIPRGASSADSSSLKTCKGMKSTRLLAEYSSNSSLSGANYPETISCSSSSSRLEEHVNMKPLAVTTSEADALSHDTAGMDRETEDYSLDFEKDEIVGLTDKDKDRRLKVKLKPKLKEEKKRQVLNGINPLNEGVDRVLNGDSSSSSSRSRVPVDTAAAPASALSQVNAASIKFEKVLDLPAETSEKKGKRKYTFQQPVPRKVAPNEVKSMGGNVERGPYFGRGKEIPLSHLHDTGVNVSLLMRGHDDDGEEVAYEEEDSPRPIYHDENDLDSLAAKAAHRLEKKELKRFHKGDKECSMSDVPGRHLLGPKMLAFIRAFPEGDVIGNDDVETAGTQRVRMEGWLQLMKAENPEGTEEGEGEENLTMLENIAIKSELLRGIEEKLMKAAACTGRGSDRSSVLLKPGTVHILLPYEVRHVQLSMTAISYADSK